MGDNLEYNRASIMIRIDYSINYLGSLFTKGKHDRNTSYIFNWIFLSNDLLFLSLLLVYPPAHLSNGAKSTTLYSSFIDLGGKIKEKI